MKMGSVEGLLDKATALLDQGKYRAALKIITEVTRLDPNNVSAYLLKGDALRDLKGYEEALISYDRAINLNPKKEFAWISKGNALRDLKRYEEALISYDRAINLNPKEEWGWISKGDVLRDLKRYEEALISYDRAIEVNPTEPLSWLAKALAMAELKKLPDALVNFNKALEIFHTERDADGERLTKLWIEELRNAISEEKSRKKPPIEVQILRKVRESLQKNPEDDPLSHIRKREEDYDRYFSKPRKIDQADNFFLVLRRWNSFTPKLPNRETMKKGGGYFLAWKGNGIAIDPGFDFIDNLDYMGYSVRDIDAIVLTHAHTDHTADLETLLCLKREQLERHGNDPKIDLFMNLGTMHKFIGWISRLEAVGKVVSLNAGDSVEPEGYLLALKATSAKHSEVIGKHCIGLIFELREGSKVALKLGITSDTGWSSRIQRQYRGCKLLCIHLGSIGENEFDQTLPLRSKKRLYEEHLGLIGTISMVKSVKPYLSIISEFGEELGNDRHLIAQALDRKFGNDRRCLTGDIGLTIQLPSLNVYCDICGDYRDCSLIKEAPITGGEKMVYYCPHHTDTELFNWSQQSVFAVRNLG